jgi:hypothetical protein
MNVGSPIADPPYKQTERQQDITPIANLKTEYTE